MYELDKEKFGAFLAQLRKEKGLTQKTLAQQLYISDKAVSKWERGLSIPDPALLVPLAQSLDVTVTELLEGRRIPADTPLDPEQTEQIVQKAIGIAEDESPFAPNRRKEGLILLIAALVGGLQTLVIILQGWQVNTTLYIFLPLMVMLGGYFALLAPGRLPKYYDENRISSFSHGPLRMNLPGVAFNNRNWPHIRQAGFLWAVVGLPVAPAAAVLIQKLFPAGVTGSMILLAAVLLGLFVPMTAAAVKWEHDKSQPHPRSWKKLAAWVLICGMCLGAFYGIFCRMGFPLSSGLRMGWVETSTSTGWNASYRYFDGCEKRQLRLPEDTALQLQVETQEGELSVTMTDADGTILYQAENIPTTSVEIPASGRVTVTMTAKKHQGGFQFSWG